MNQPVLRAAPMIQQTHTEVSMTYPYTEHFRMSIIHISTLTRIFRTTGGPSYPRKRP